MSQEGRYEVIKMMRADVGFDFKEEDLPPKMRKEITKLAQEIDQIHNLRDLEEKARLEAHRNKSTFYAFLIAGFISLFIAIVSVYLALTSVLLFLVGYYFNGLSLKENRKAIDYKFQGDNKWQEFVQETTSLGTKAYKELTALYEARVRPTVRQVTIDFARIIQAAKGKGIILETIECPYCKAPVKLPKNGDSFECQHCNKTIKAINVFDILKGIMD